MAQGSLYGRCDHDQAEVDDNHSEPEILNFYVQKSQVLSFMRFIRISYHLTRESK